MEQSTISEELLLKYINNQLSSEEKWEVERKLADSSLLSDAEEGLQLFNEKKELNVVVQSINKKMKQRLKDQEQNKKIHSPRIFLLLTATAILLLLIIMGFWIIYRLKSQ
jgi:hypothetical protein